jgi:Helix-turn-helix domain/Protein of unknown function (DUF2690)
MPRGRPERELDPAGGPIPVFAAQLRDLREEAGRPSYRDLARKACYSRTALSEAAAGRELPSLSVTLAFVRACDGPVEVWRRRWQVAAAAVGSVPSPEPLPADRSAPGTAPPDVPPPTPERPVAVPIVVRRARPTARVLLVVAVVGAVIAGGLLIGRFRIASGGVPADPPNAQGSAAVSTGSAPIVDGAPPGRDHCDADNALLDGADLRDGTGAVIGRLELRYSPRCATAWARLVPSGAVNTLAGITMTIIRHPDGTVMGARGLTPAGRLHTDVVRLPPGTCAQAQVSLARPGYPPASAATTCQAPHLPHASSP